MVFEHLLFTTVLKLYDIGEIDLLKWIASEEVVLENVTEEFSLEYCFSKIKEVSPNLFGISKLRVLKKQQKNPKEQDTIEEKDEIFEVIVLHNEGDVRIEEKILATDFIIKVDKKP